MTAGIPRWLSSCTSSSLPRRTLDLLRSHAIARDATRSGEPPCWNRLVVASAAEVTIRTLSSGLVAYFLGGSITDRPARLRRQADSAYRLHRLRGRPSRPHELTAAAPGRTSVVSSPKQLSKPLRATPKPAHVLTFREGHTPDIESHLPVVTEPRPGERCVLCDEPAGKVVLGPIERVSGLRRRTPVCTKCANSRTSRPRPWPEQFSGR